MQGLGVAGTERWGQWVHPVSKCLDRCLTLDEVVWANVTRHRTPGTTMKDRATTKAEQTHGLRQHLTLEPSVLQPSVVLAVGTPALEAVQPLAGKWRLLRIKQRGASKGEAMSVRDEIRSLGLCRQSTS